MRIPDRRRPRFRAPRLRVPRLGALELARFGRGRLPRAGLVAVMLLPLLYGALYVWSMWDPYGHVDRLPVALVNQDRGTTAGGGLHAGDDLARQLEKRRVFDWRAVTAADAEHGLKHGDYYMTLTIPPDFSSRIASPQGEATPRGTALRVRTNDSNSYLSGIIARSAFKEIRTAGSVQASKGYFDRIFVSFADLHRQTAKAADGADELRRGAGAARDGSGKLKKGAGDLSGGLDEAKGGSASLSAGLDRAAAGSKDLADGLGRLHAGAARAASGTAELAKLAHGHDATVDLLRRRPKEVRAAADAVAEAAGAVHDNARRLPGLTGKARAGTAKAASAAEKAYAALCPGGRPARPAPVPSPPASATPSGAPAAPDTSAAPHGPGSGAAGGGPAQDRRGGASAGASAAQGCTALKDARDAARDASSAAARADRYVAGQDLDQLAADAKTVRGDARRLSAAAPRLGDDLAGAVADIDRLDKGVKALSSGSAELRTGADGLRTGLGSLGSGSRTLGAGLVRLSDGAGQLGTGLDDLNGGLAALTSGSGRLADGLHDGTGKIPAYGASERDRRADVMSDPVQLAMKHLNKTANYGTGFAPYFVPLALWVGVMVGYMLLRPLNNRLLSANAPAWRAWLAGYLPSVALAVPQIAVLMAVLHWGLGMHVARPAAALGFLLLVCASFGAVLQFLNARFGPAGRVLGLALLMVQLTSAGGTYPVETSPGFFGAVHPWLPMSWAVEAMRRLISGGDPTVVWQACGVLVAYLVAFAALTVLTARRRQVWTLSRLHPELTL